MEWQRTSRYAWTSDAGYTITACRVPRREGMPETAHPAPYGTEYDNLVPLFWHYVLYAPVKHPTFATADEGLIGASWDPSELREQAVSHERARVLGGHR